MEEYQDGENNIKDEEIEDAMKELIVELKKNKKTLKHEKNGEENEEFDGDDGDEWMDVEDEEN